MSPATASATAPPSSATPFLESMIEIGKIAESKTNPRRHFDETALQELAGSIRVVGVLQALIVRPDGKGGYELVAGARRLRASKIAGLEAVPCRIKPFTDREMLEAQIVENLQRQDVHPIDEADGYAALQKADKAYTVDAIAARVSRTPAYVRSRLKLCALAGPARQAFEKDQITAGHAAILVQVPAKLQKDALRACFYEMFDDEDGATDAMALRPVRELQDWFNEHVVLDLQAAETQESFPELVKAVDAVTAAGGTIVPISHAWFLDAAAKRLKPVPLTTNQWRDIKKARCENVVTGIFLLGRGRAETLEVCTNQKCAAHWPELNRKDDDESPKRALSKWEIESRKKQAAQRAKANAFSKVKVEAIGQLLAKGKGKALTDAQVAWMVSRLAPTALNHPKMLQQLFGPPKAWTAVRAPELLFACFTLKGCYAMADVAAALKKAGVDVLKIAEAAKAGSTTPAGKPAAPPTATKPAAAANLKTAPWQGKRSVVRKGQKVVAPKPVIRKARPVIRKARPVVRKATPRAKGRKK